MRTEQYRHAVLTCLAVVGATFGTTASAQDFRVTTSLSQRAGDDVRWTPVSNSITYFHAGQVYDHIEKVREVVIFEPAQSRFVILSFNGNQLATTIQFAELQQFLKVAMADIKAHAERLDAASPSESERQRKNALSFQLNPVFETEFNPKTKTIALLSPLIRYDVETESTNKPHVTEQYLEYADWAVRMNYVLHSGSIYPNVRQSVNRELMARDRIPTEVRLFLEGDPPLQFKAEHKFDWKLTSTDKAMIRRCENARTAADTRWVTFREYQRTLVAAIGRISAHK